MAIEINQAVKVPTASNYGTQKVAVDVSTSAKTETAVETTAPSSNFSVTPATDLNTEESKKDKQENKESVNNKGQQPTEKEIKSKIDQANSELRHAKTGLDFKYHEATKRVSITVYDKDTKEVIREIPPEKTLDMLEKMWELAGMVVDDRG